jgi:hypothetical protein
VVVAKAKPHHAQKPYILEITKNAPVSGAFLCSMKDIRVSGIALRNAVSALRRRATPADASLLIGSVSQSKLQAIPDT